MVLPSRVAADSRVRPAQRQRGRSGSLAHLSATAVAGRCEHGDIPPADGGRAPVQLFCGTRAGTLRCGDRL